MKFRTDESFLFPASQLDFRRENITFPAGALHGLGAADPVKVDLPSWGSTYLYLKDAEQAAALPRYPNLPVQPNGAILRSDLIKAQIAAIPEMNNADMQSLLNELLAAQASMGVVSQAAAPAAQEAAIAVATATQQAQDVANIEAMRVAANAYAERQAAEAAAAKQAADAEAARQAASEAGAAAALAQRPVSFSLDLDAEGTMILVGKRADGTTLIVTKGADNIDAYLVRNTNQTRFDLAQTAAYVKEVKRIADAAAAATSTHQTGVDTSTGTVKTIDAASGSTSTVNANTGAITVTTPAGTVTGAGSVNAGGIITTVDTKTGTVTTQNTQTGVVTQTNAATGQTQTAVQVTGTAATGGTFLMPDGKTVTTTTPITATGGLDAGKLALFGLLGVLLLRGAIK